MTNDEREWKRYLLLMRGLYAFSFLLLLAAVITLVYRAQSFWDWIVVVLISAALLNLLTAKMRP